MGWGAMGGEVMGGEVMGWEVIGVNGPPWVMNKYSLPSSTSLLILYPSVHF